MPRGFAVARAAAAASGLMVVMGAVIGEVPRTAGSAVGLRIAGVPEERLAVAGDSPDTWAMTLRA